MFIFFFFQAEDGIRDGHVTGVQTCALPISGGMRQRVAFLRTLLAGKEVLLLDEPFGALDSITRGRMQEWLAEALAAQPSTVMLVTHDVEEALLLGDVVAVLSA